MLTLSTPHERIHTYIPTCRYKFEARLGQGRHNGTLYRARDEHGDVCAVEVVQQEQQKKRGSRKLGQLGGKLGLREGEEEEEAYTDFKTGARCFVSRLPRESMRQRLSRGAGGLGLGTVLRWAKQLATAVVKSNGRAAGSSSRTTMGDSSSTAPGVLGLDSLWLDETDCILVGDYRPSSYAMPPSSSYGYQTESEEELEEEAEERVVGVAEAKQAPAAATAPEQRPSSDEEEEEDAPQPRVLGEEEVKAFGVLLYQLATKTALPGDTAQAYDEILARAAARGAGDEASGKQALLELLRQALQQQRDAEAAERTGRGAWDGEEERAPRSEELAPLAELIADALMGKPQLASNLLAAVPSPRSSRPAGSGVSSPLIAPAAAAAAAGEDKSETQPPQLPGPVGKEEEGQKQQQEVHAHALLSLARAAVVEEEQPPVLSVALPAPAPAAPSPSARSLPSLSPAASFSSADLGADAPAPLRPILGALRQTKDANLRHRALYGLKKLGSKAAEPPVLLALMEAMLDAEPADPVARRMAAWTLGSLGEVAALMGAVPALIKALGDAEPGVRAAAAWALGGMGRAAEKQGALATLLHRSVKDVDAQVRELAGKSLARLKRVTGMKRRRPSESEGSGSGSGAISSSEDGDGTGARLEAYYSKRRPISLASTTRSMAEACIDDHASSASSSGLPPLIPIPPQHQPQPQQPLTALWVGAPGVPHFQFVHAPGTGQPVALAMAPSMSLSSSSGSLASSASASSGSSAVSSAASSPTALSAQQAAVAGNLYYVVGEQR